MSATILQQVLARAREDFTVASATPGLVPGTRRLLQVTEGSYLDITGTLSGSYPTADNTTLRIFVDGAAVGEGTEAHGHATAATGVTLATRTRVGPTTAAQAERGIIVELRSATNAGTLTVNASTSPTFAGAVLTATEAMLDDAEPTLPVQVPHCLLWLKADSGVTKNGVTKEVTAWENQAPAVAIDYTLGTSDFTPGQTATGATSGATGTVLNKGGSTEEGTLVLTDVRGTFLDGEAITDPGLGFALAASAPTPLSITAAAGSAPTYELGVMNGLPGLFFDGAKNANFVLGQNPQQGTALEVFAVVSLDGTQRAGATLLAPDAVVKADCLVVTLSNATLNRNALLDTGAPEYVSTTTTISTGKALMRWRYNVGTTTGAAGVNGEAEVADATFTPPADIAWRHIGSPAQGDYAIGGFRLCELIVYAVFQAAAEDAVSESDIRSIRDYLNSKYGVY